MTFDNKDRFGLLVVAATIAALLAYRAHYVEPREWVGICGANSSLACAPRAALLWLQHYQLWGLGALILGLWSFIGARFPAAVAAVALGVAAVINYNATWGMLGAALGAWSWIRRERAPAPGAKR